MFKPIEVRPLPGYRLDLRYSDGVEGQADLSSLVGRGVFALWSDVRQFESVSIGPSGEIRWSDQVDLCPDALYLEITGKSPEDAFPKIGQSADAL